MISWILDSTGANLVSYMFVFVFVCGGRVHGVVAHLWTLESSMFVFARLCKLESYVFVCVCRCCTLICVCESYVCVCVCRCCTSSHCVCTSLEARVLCVCVCVQVLYIESLQISLGFAKLLADERDPKAGIRIFTKKRKK
jgi:hypothetical protein